MRGSLPDLESSQRRVFLIAGLLTPFMQTSAFARPPYRYSEAVEYLSEISAYLELPVTRSIQLKVASGLPSQELFKIIISVHVRLVKLIGSALSTARETVAASIVDDMNVNRSRNIYGLNFSETELALLLASRHG